MNTRIKKLRESEGLTQEEFGKRIGSARNTIANYETGNRNPSNAVITSICREFDINEDWLRYGTGPMYRELDDALSAHVAEIVTGDDDFIKDLISVYMELDAASKLALKNLASKMADKYTKSKREQD